jgi:hypothetical protein
MLSSVEDRSEASPTLWDCARSSVERQRLTPESKEHRPFKAETAGSIPAGRKFPRLSFALASRSPA